MSAAGIEHWFGIYQPAIRFRVLGPAAGPPIMLLTGQPRFGPSPTNFRIGRSTIWLSARLFDVGAGPTEYVGFVVRRGELSFAVAPIVSGDAIDPQGALNATLTVQLAKTRSPDDAGACSVTTAEIAPELTIVISNGQASLAAVAGAVTIGSESLAITVGGGGSIDATLGRLVFDGLAEPHRLDTALLSHDVARFSGEIEVTSAGWSLPVVSIADPLDLGEAAEGAAFVLVSSDRVEVDWPGRGRSQVEQAADGRLRMILSGITMLVGYTEATVRATGAPGDGGSFEQDFRTWSIGESGQPLTINCSSDESWTWQSWCSRELGAGIAFSGSTELLLDRPRLADGRPLRLTRQPVVVGIVGSAPAFRVVVGARSAVPSDPDQNPDRPRTMALENAYIAFATCRLIGLSGLLSEGGRLVDGRLALLLGVSSWLPTLPDPYVTNVGWSRSVLAEPSTRASLVAGVSWVDNEPLVEFRGFLGTPELTRANRTKPGSQSAPDLRASPGSAPAGAVSVAPDTRGAQSELDLAVARAARAAEHSRSNRQAAVERVATGLAGRVRGRDDIPLTLREFRLLDVSTRKDQIGVTFGTAAGRDAGRVASGRAEGPRAGAPPEAVAAAIANGSVFAVAGLDLQVSLAALRIFMLPQVQWEPVRTLPKDQKLEEIGYVPTPLAAADDGGATVIGSRSATLIATIPDVAVDRIVSEYPGGQRVGVLTTLPFGLKALLVLQPTPWGGLKADSLDLERPAFGAGSGLRGGLQLKLTAAGGVTIAGEQSPSFEGAAAQLLNGVDLRTGDPLGLSVLGGPLSPEQTVESMFNNEFLTARPRVPVTRLDLSGYGASTFSDWVNPFGAFAEATKVQFQVLVGRTSLEVVKFATVVYPWGIKLTRSVTVERRGGGGVVRRDTGWEATSPGLFDFRYVETDALGKPIKDAAGNPKIAPSPYDVHPGLVQGVFNVNRIRPTGAAPISMVSPSVGEILLTPIFFDGDLQVEGIAGNGSRTRANGLLGFLHVKPVGKPISAEDLAALIVQQGAVGGPIDIAVEIGESRFKVHATRVEVDQVRDAGGPRFVGVIRGAPIFGPNGAWSVIRMSPPGGSPVAGDAETLPDGGAVIRSGKAEAPVADRINIPGPRGDYRFADAGDLFREASPGSDYGFLQTAPTHAFVYRRPRVTKGVPEIRSSLAPCFADVFARFTSDGLFPPVENTIQLIDQPHVLAVNAEGRFGLSPPVTLPSIPRADLELARTAGQVARVAYGEASMRLHIDPASWSLEMPGLRTWSGFDDMPDLVGAGGDLVGSSAGPFQFRDMSILLDPTIDDILSFIPGMSPRDKATVDLAATNLKQKAKVKIPFAKATLIRVPPAPADPLVEVKFKAWASVALGSEKKAPSQASPSGATLGFVDAVVGFEAVGKIHPPPLKPFFVVLGLEFEVGAKVYLAGPKAGAPKGEINIKAFVGIGIEGKLGPFKASAYLGAGPAVQRDKDGLHFGGVVKIEAEVDLKVLSINIAGELLGLYKDTAAKAVIEYEGEVSINVEILFFSISETVGTSGEIDL